MTDHFAELYPAHLQQVTAQAAEALARAKRDHLLIASGAQRYRFLDDMPYPFYVNPHFKHWLPLTAQPHCWISFAPGSKPTLIYYQPEDFWHVPPQNPHGYWVDHFNIRVVREPQEAYALFPKDLSRAAIIGEENAMPDGIAANNPPEFLNFMHLARTRKSAYELECMRIAGARACQAHLAAATAFREKKTEQEIHLIYCRAAGHNETELPYGNIVALNEHAATLHYQHQSQSKPKQHYALLLDAGAQANGYAADITRTHGNGDPIFSELLESLERAQQELCAKVRPGQSFPDLHLEAHRRIARILQEQDLVQMEPESMVELGISSTFFPHGLGHLIGLQVHDVGGFLKDESGETIAKPKGHSFLRLTRDLEAGNVLTIEPGIYFIESLLAELHKSKHSAQVNWFKIEHLRKFGGIRIEDNLAVTADAPENLTRNAFRAVEAGIAA